MKSLFKKIRLNFKTKSITKDLKKILINGEKWFNSLEDRPIKKLYASNNMTS